MAQQKLCRLKNSELNKLIDLLNKPKDEQLKMKLVGYRNTKPEITTGKSQPKPEQ